MWSTQDCDTPSTAAPGSFSVTCRATDVAGNHAEAPARYTVEARTCLANLDRTALAPVNADGSSVFARNSGVPVVFSACDAAGRPLGTKDLVRSVTQLSSTALPGDSVVNEQKYPPSANFSFTRSTGTWTGYIQASKLTPGKQYVYRVLLSDGSSFTMTFGVR